MTRSLHISDSVSLPLDFVTKTCGILAQRRKGKTYTASVIAEELVAAKAPWVALDPTGAWWGLRAASNDAESSGLPVIIFGGQHADVPLERTGGKLVAEMVIDSPGYYIVDFSLFESKEAERQFATDFAERLYRLKKQPNKDFAMHLFVDEADMFVPQQSPSGDRRMLGAFEALVRRGGLSGLGTTLISQRAAVVNKNVLEQLDILIVLRNVGPNDRKAIDGYIQSKGSEAERREMMGSLASLKLGEAWIWEPGADPPLFNQVTIRERHTFNSSATPKTGERRVEPRQLAEVDIDAVKERMAATIEKAKADDPKELRKIIAERDKQIAELKRNATPREQETQRIAQLETELEKARAKVKTEHKVVEKKVVVAADLSRLEKLPEQYEALVTKLAAIQLEAKTRAGAIKDLITSAEALNATQLQIAELPVGPKDSVAVAQTPFRRDSVASRIARGPLPDGPVSFNVTRLKSATGAHSMASTNGDFTPTGKQQEILNALAWWESVGNRAPTLPQVGAVALIAAPSGHFNNLIGPLSSNGMVQREGGRLCLTDGGRARAAIPTTAPSLDDYHVALRERVLNSRKATPRTVDMLNVIISCGGRDVSLKEIGELASIAYPSGHFNNTFGPLSTLGLVKRTGGVARPTEILFPPDL